MKVSIIMPAYNEQDHIEQAIQSALNQSHRNLELIVASDASSDRTNDIVRAFTAQDERVQLIDIKNRLGNPGSVRNIAIEKASGEYLAFLDADDVWMPTKLADQIEFMLARNASISTTHIDVISESGDVIGDYKPEIEKASWADMLKENYVTTSACMIDRRVHPIISFPALRRSEDFACWMGLLKQSADLYVLDKVLTHYRVEPVQFWKSKPKQLYYRYKVHRKVLNRSFFETFCDMTLYIYHGLNKTSAATNKRK